jgi:hypothetical protein
MIEANELLSKLTLIEGLLNLAGTVSVDFTS